MPQHRAAPTGDGSGNHARTVRRNVLIGGGAQVGAELFEGRPGGIVVEDVISGASIGVQLRRLAPFDEAADGAAN